MAGKLPQIFTGSRICVIIVLHEIKLPIYG